MTTDAPPELAFLRECHEAKMANFDNTEKIPEGIQEKYRFNVEDTEKLWKRYLHWKFIYLLGLDQKSQVSDDDFLQQIKNRGPPESSLTEFIAKWKEKKDDEKVVYIYRYTQIPVELVHDFWYTQNITPCVKWCEKRKREIKNLEEDASDVSTESLKTKVAEIYRRLPGEPFLDVYRDWALALICQKGLGELTDKIEKTYRDLIKCPVTQIAKLTEVCQNTLDDIESFCQSIVAEYNGLSITDSRISLIEFNYNLVNVIFSTFDEQEVIKCFLLNLKNKFNCEVCDYCDYKNFNENKEWIVWRTATVTEEDLSKEMQMLSLEERRRRIRHRESYKKGEGISGSILLQANDVIWNLWHHTGSNNVLKDPRQSASHRHAYEKEIYPSVLKFDGEIHNFWMFPIFDSGKLIGGVRVVNKLESPGNLQVGGWPYLTRIELSLIVAWFSKFLESYKEKIHKKADLFASNVGESQINELMSKLQTSWIDTQMFSAILKHFQRMIFKREEKRKIGSSVLLIDGTIGDQLQEYPGIDIYDMSYPYNELDSFADVFSPLLGMYVFDENGFNKIALLNFMDENRTAVSEYEAIRAITRMHKRAIFIILPRDKQNILFYKEGEKAAELYLAEKIGEWRFRSVEHMRQESLENAEIENKEFIETVLETSLELSSRRLGGLIVLGDLSRDVFRFSTKLKCFRGDIVLDKNWTPYLFEYAKLDGATVIDKFGRLAYVNTNINPINDTVNLEIFCERGARHEAGEKICRLAPQALVVIISENGGISILKNKKALIKEY